MTTPPIKISDEAHAAASRAAEGAYRRWHETPNRDAYVSGFIALAAKTAVEAAAPLIAAQVLQGAEEYEEWSVWETAPGHGPVVWTPADDGHENCDCPSIEMHNSDWWAEHKAEELREAGSEAVVRRRITTVLIGDWTDAPESNQSAAQRHERSESQNVVETPPGVSGGTQK